MTLRGPITVFELNQSDLPGAIASVGNGGRYRDVGITHTVFGVSSLTASDKCAQFPLCFHPHFLVVFGSHRIFLPFQIVMNALRTLGSVTPVSALTPWAVIAASAPTALK